MRIRWSLVLVFLIGSMLAACGTPTPVVTQEPVVQPTGTPAAAATEAQPAGPAPASIRIGAVLPLTGPASVNGKQVKSGYELAVANINANGGVMVKQYNAKIPLELKIVDNESNPANVGPALDSLNTDDHVVAYLGAVNAMMVVGAPVAEKNQIPFIGVAFAQASIHQQGYKYLFAPFPKTNTMVKAMYDILDTLPQDKKPKNVGILTENSDIGNELAGVTTQEAGARGYQVVDTEQFIAGTTDYADIISKIKAANVEVLVGVMAGPDGVNIVKEMVKQDYVPKFTMYVRAADGATWTTDTNMAGDYVTISPGWHNALLFPGVKELNQEYQAENGRLSDPLVGPGYASVQILADAIERADTLSPDAIRKAFATTDMETVVGPVTFNADGTGNVTTPIVQYQHGVAQLIWPKEFATAELVYPAPPYAGR